jgi:predicted ATPase/class 3 adenylate cyclase
MTGTYPSGTVTFVLTDIEGSTQLLAELGEEPYADALAGHREVIRTAFTGHGGVEVDEQGDAFFFAFASAREAARAAAGAQTRLAGGRVRVRMGLHTGEALLTDGHYVGMDVHRAARIAACGHGGQVVLSPTTVALLDPDELELRDLGEHRLKDLSAPLRLYQLGTADFPSLKTLHRTNLPIPATPFLGRERELEELTRLLGEDGARLLTLTGPGGVGKTRLALQLAATLSERHPDGVFWTPLARFRDSELVASSVVQALGLEARGESPAAQLVSYLAGRRVLLLLDNCEHLLPAVAAEVAALRDIGGPTLLVTSRERLQLNGERVYPVAPMSRGEGVSLFVSRARALDPAFQSSPAASELCDRLDELPLALELAAARTPLFSPEELVENLGPRLDLFKGGRDADPRHETLRATVAWSHDLLAPAEQQLVRRLAIFIDGCTYEAAAAVCDAEPDTLQSLVDKSLVRRRDDAAGRRFWMLETIREFATERLADSDETDELRRRHARFFLELAEASEGSVGADERRWFDRLETDRSNLGAAHLGGIESADADATYRFVKSLWWFWALRGHLQEAHRLIEATLTLEPPTPTLHTWGLTAAAVIARDRGDLPTSVRFAQAAADLEGSDDAPYARAIALTLVGDWLGISAGRYDEALDLYATAARVGEKASDHRAIAWPLMSRATTLQELKYLGEARVTYERALEHNLRNSDAFLAALCQLSLAQLLIEEGNLVRAESFARDSLPAFVAHGSRPCLAFAFDELSVVAALRHDSARGARLYGAARRLLDEIGRASWGSGADSHETREQRAVGRMRESLGEQRYEELVAEGRALTIEAAIDLALEGEEPSS